MAYPERPLAGTVLHWREGAVAHIRFNRPQALNAIDTELAQAFLDACQEVAADPEVRVVWLSAEGRAFMAGGDIAQMAQAPLSVADKLIPGMHGALRILARIDAPVVASVQGAVAGGGLGLILGGADFVIAADGTKFSVAYPLIGTSCDCSTSWGLPRLLGMRRALELALLGESIDAEEAARLGLCNRVVPVEDLESESRTLVERLGNGPTLAYGHLRRLIRASFDSTFSEQLDAEADGFRKSAATLDFREGVDAFLGKRRPKFEGH